MGVFEGPLESYAVADAHDGVINGKGDGRTRENMQSLGTDLFKEGGSFKCLHTTNKPKDEYPNYSTVLLNHRSS